MKEISWTYSNFYELKTKKQDSGRIRVKKKDKIKSVAVKLDKTSWTYTLHRGEIKSNI